MARVVPASALLAALLAAAGCGKKPDPQPEVTVAPDPTPKPDPKPTPADPTPAKGEAVRRLKQVGLAAHGFESAYGFLPAGVVGPKSQLGLSWRVAILPFLGDDGAKLYNQFKLAEPWDSDANKQLLDKMPAVFASPGEAAPAGMTHVRSFAGPKGFIPAGPHDPKGKPVSPWANRPAGTVAAGRPFPSITDGTSNTLMAVESAEPVEWTRPDDLLFPETAPAGAPGAKSVPLPKLGGVFPDGFHALMCDGAVRFIPSTLGEGTLGKLISVNGGELLTSDEVDVVYPPARPRPKIPADVPADLADAAARRAAVANFQKVVAGLHAHADALGYLPAGVVGPDRSVGLSWRVAVLPFVGEEALYKEFKLGEAWDSEHNKPLVAKMPAVFAPAGKPAEQGHTFVRTTTGPGGVLRTVPAGPPAKGKPASQPGQIAPGPKFPAGFPDGTSNTILLVEAGEAVPWTKPDELYLPSLFDPKGLRPAVPEAKLPPLGGPFADGFHAAMADGRVTFYKAGYPTGHLAELFCPNDGYMVGPLGKADKIGYSVSPPVANPKNPAPKASEVKTK